MAAKERKKHLFTDLLCFERAHFKVFIFICFLSWRMQTFQRARNVWRLNSQISLDDTFVHYPLFALKILLFILFTFSYRNFFPVISVICCFDSSRRHRQATTHATGRQIVRAQMTSLDAIFCRGNKSSSRSRSGFALGNKFELDLEAMLSYRICITSRALLATTKNAVSS